MSMVLGKGNLHHSTLVDQRNTNLNVIVMQPPRTPSRNTYYLTPDEVASRLRVTSEQVRSLIRKGILRAINVGAGGKRPLYRISSEALQDFINRDCTPSSPVVKRRTRKPAFTPDFFPDLK